MRCDANVSVRPAGQREFGTKTEIKNMNSFRFIEKALDYEIRRQIKVLNEGGRIVQETRLWDPTRGVTESMRSKEEAHDYRYFPDPDLMPIKVDNAWIEQIKSQLVELPAARQQRFISQYGLPEHDAELLTAERATAEWFEQAVKSGGEPKAVSNWIMGELMRLLNEESKQIDDCGLRPEQLAGLLKLMDKGVISGRIAKTVFEDMYKTGRDAEVIVNEKGLVQMSDETGIEAIVDEVLNKSPQEVERIRAGDAKLMGFFVGQIMKMTKGKANPKIVNEMLRKKLGS